MASTKTIQNSLDWCKQFVYSRILSLGDYKEPAITSSNTVMQTILGRPFRWPENRIVTGFVSTASQQDYFLLYTWVASTAVSLGWRVIDTNGNSQRVTTAGTTNSSAPSWNASTGGTTTDGGAVWTNDGPIPNAAATYSFGWLENVSVQDPTAVKWYQISNKVDLALDSSTARPQNVSAELVGTLGLTIRTMPVPDKAYPIAITMQQGAPLITSLNATWSPLPDYLGFVYNVGLLSYMYEFADDSRWVGARQRFIAGLLSAAVGLTQTEVDIFLANFNAISLGQMDKQATLNSGLQHRGV